MKILLVEDDPRLSRSLARLLEQDRHNVEVAPDGETGLDIALGENGIDVVILDIGLPDISGLDVARRIRQERRDLAILMLTARDTVADRVDGLDSGADDYLVKPFAFEELSARLRALVRRADGTPREGTVLRVGSITLDETRRTVAVDGGPVSLTAREFALLEALLRHAGQVLSRDQLLDLAWPAGIAVTPNTVDAFVAFLRRKLGSAADRIETVRGIGYRMVAS
jgi:DNA-binding response OmpR family regulator